jgi:hypothetical protein
MKAKSLLIALTTILLTSCGGDSSDPIPRLLQSEYDPCNKKGVCTEIKTISLDQIRTSMKAEQAKNNKKANPQFALSLDHLQKDIIKKGFEEKVTLVGDLGNEKEIPFKSITKNKGCQFKYLADYQKQDPSTGSAYLETISNLEIISGGKNCRKDLDHYYETDTNKTKELYTYYDSEVDVLEAIEIGDGTGELPPFSQLKVLELKFRGEKAYHISAEIMIEGKSHTVISLYFANPFLKHSLIFTHRTGYNQPHGTFEYIEKLRLPEEQPGGGANQIARANTNYNNSGIQLLFHGEFTPHHERLVLDALNRNKHNINIAFNTEAHFNKAELYGSRKYNYLSDRLGIEYDFIFYRDNGKYYPTLALVGKIDKENLPWKYRKLFFKDISWNCEHDNAIVIENLNSEEIDAFMRLNTAFGAEVRGNSVVLRMNTIRKEEEVRKVVDQSNLSSEVPFIFQDIHGSFGERSILLNNEKYPINTVYKMYSGADSYLKMYFGCSL